MLQSTILCSRAVWTAVFFLLAGCGSGSPFVAASACDGYVACCNAFPELQRNACLSAVERLRSQPGAESTCAEQLRQWQGSGACGATADDAAIDSGVRRDGSVSDAPTNEGGPVVVVGGYTLQALALVRRSRTNRGVLDVSLRLGVDSSSASAPMVAALFRVVGDDGLERIGTSGAPSQCPESALVAPGATVACAVAFEVPATVRVLRLVYQTPNAARLEAAAPAESELPSPPLQTYLTREGAGCSTSGCNDCLNANQVACGLRTPGQCAALADAAWECTSLSCSAISAWMSCMQQREGATAERCITMSYPVCAARVENTQNLCTDGRDNDGDNYIDCDDRDCCSVINTSSCAASTFCGRQSCPEQLDVSVTYRSCSHAAYSTLLACVTAAQSDAAARVCFEAAPPVCANCVAYARSACITAGTSGACNREWNCYATCIIGACPTADAACQDNARVAACSAPYATYTTCRDNDVTCRTAYMMCEVTP